MLLLHLFWVMNKMPQWYLWSRRGNPCFLTNTLMSNKAPDPVWLFGFWDFLLLQVKGLQSCLDYQRFQHPQFDSSIQTNHNLWHSSPKHCPEIKENICFLVVFKDALVQAQQSKMLFVNVAVAVFVFVLFSVLAKVHLLCILVLICSTFLSFQV